MGSLSHFQQLLDGITEKWLEGSGDRRVDLKGQKYSTKTTDNC